MEAVYRFRLKGDSLNVRFPAGCSTYLLILLLLARSGCVAMAREIAVSTAAEIGQATPSLQPGDVLIMQDGDWVDQAIVFHGSGTKEQGITLRAATPGR